MRQTRAAGTQSAQLGKKTCLKTDWCDYCMQFKRLPPQFLVAGPIEGGRCE